MQALGLREMVEGHREERRRGYHFPEPEQSSLMLKLALTTLQGLDKFSKGYETMGFQVANDGTITYREWAPAADAAWLIGDFSERILIHTTVNKAEMSVFSERRLE